MERLIDAAERTGLSERQKLEITMFPGLLFGFAPSNYRELKERLDCPDCLNICRKLKSILELKTPRGLKFLLPWVRREWHNNRAEAVLEEIKILESQDSAHWREEKNREISKELVTAFCGRDGWVQ